MTRSLRIAVREYGAYVRTVGFWMSVCLMPVGFVVAIFAPTLITRHTPPAAIAVIDDSGLGVGADVRSALARFQDASDGARVRVATSPPSTGRADADGRSLRAYLEDDARTPDGTRLDAAAILRASGDRVAVDFWSRNPTAPALQARVSEAVSEVMRRRVLERAGLGGATLSALERTSPDIAAYSPKAQSSGRVVLRDELPAFIGLGMGVLLWAVILTGAGILLNGVIEEKSSRILEVLLASASTIEIMAGKILGVAAVTATVLGVWITIGLTALISAQPGIGADLAAALLSKGLLLYFGFYFLTGYLMYAILFITIGAFCETSREAQTLLGPMMILLSVPMVFLSQAVARPDAPLLVALSWFPPFTPFLMAARAASGPPLWQVLGTGALMAAVLVIEGFAAVRAFRAGALSSGRFDLRRFIAGVTGRAEA